MIHKNVNPEPEIWDVVRHFKNRRGEGPGVEAGDSPSVERSAILDFIRVVFV